jgi:tetratricopeptide (TPR) repeat protein
MNGKSSKIRAWTGMALVLTVLSALCLAATAQEETADEWVKKGDELLRNGSTQEALAAYDKSLQIDPENDTTLIQVAIMYDSLGYQAAAKALGIIEKKLERNPQDAQAWQARGIALAQLGMMQEANQSFDKAIGIYDQEIQKDPKNGTVWWHKAKLLANLERFQDALSAAEKVIELDHPRKVDAWILKGAILIQLGKFDESLKSYNKAIELDPENISAWLGKRRVLDAMGRNDESDATNAKLKEMGYKG